MGATKEVFRTALTMDEALNKFTCNTKEWREMFPDGIIRDLQYLAFKQVGNNHVEFIGSYDTELEAFAEAKDYNGKTIIKRGSSLCLAFNDGAMLVAIDYVLYK